jgi:putative phosphoesterase
MRLGLISDTHDNVALARVAGDLFRVQRVERTIHLGDVMTRPVLEPLDAPVVLRGNNDPPSMGVDAWGDTYEGVRIGAHHGHFPWTGGEVDLLLHGHSHRMRNDIMGRTRVVNPGALHRAAVRTVAIVELPTLDVTFYEVRADGAVPLASASQPKLPRALEDF